MKKMTKSWEEYKRTAMFNGKLYRRNIMHFSTKEGAKKGAKHIRKKMKKNVIVDKNITGYFLWIRGKS